MSSSEALIKGTDLLGSNIHFDIFACGSKFSGLWIVGVVVKCRFLLGNGYNSWNERIALLVWHLLQ